MIGVVLGLVACDRACPDTSDPRDPPLEVVLGETVDDAFAPLSMPRPEFGPQGGQHLWLATTVYEPGPAPVSFEIRLEAAERRGDTWSVLGGFARWLDDPRPIGAIAPWVVLDLQLIVSAWDIRRDRRLTLTVTDACDRVGHDEFLLPGDSP